MQDTYRTIKEQAQAEFKIERSRFIGTAVPIATRDAAEAAYDTIRRRYHDATHNCFAYRVGIDDEKAETRSSDDGEPSGTAGRPILDALNSGNVTNTLVVVTRYFGGVKLGTGGLARAYRQAADQVLATAVIVERLIEQRFCLRFGHDETSVVMHALAELRIKPARTDYTDDVVVYARIRRSQFKQLRTALIERSRGRVVVEAIEGEELD